MKGLNDGSVKNFTKLKKTRIRTWSSDSGCDVECHYPDLSLNIMEDSFQTWAAKLDSVVRKETKRAREMTSLAKDEMKLAGKGMSSFIRYVGSGDRY